jgi:hypothetical protein
MSYYSCTAPRSLAQHTAHPDLIINHLRARHACVLHQSLQPYTWQDVAQLLSVAVQIETSIRAVTPTAGERRMDVRTQLLDVGALTAVAISVAAEAIDESWSALCTAVSSSSNSSSSSTTVDEQAVSTALFGPVREGLR